MGNGVGATVAVGTCVGGIGVDVGGMAVSSGGYVGLGVRVAVLVGTDVGEARVGVWGKTAVSPFPKPAQADRKTTVSRRIRLMTEK